jgi:DNA-nicking Smr family endonuclease
MRPLAIDDWLDLGGADSFLRSGLPRTLLRDLRRGRWSIQDHVDLHGMNRHEAHEQVALFLAEALAAGKRCLRIVHGRGHGSPGREGDSASVGQGLARSLQGCAGILSRTAQRRR